MVKAQPPQPIVDPPVLLWDTRNWDGVAAVIENEGSAGAGWDLDIERAVSSDADITGGSGAVVLWDGWTYTATLIDTDGTTGLNWSDLDGTPATSPITLMVYFGPHPYVVGERSGNLGVWNPGSDTGSFTGSSRFRMNLTNGASQARPDFLLDVEAELGFPSSDPPESGGNDNPDNLFFRWWPASIAVRARTATTTIFSSSRDPDLPAVDTFVAHYDKPLVAPEGLASTVIDADYGGLTYFTDLVGRHHTPGADDPRFGDGATLATVFAGAIGSVSIVSLRGFEEFSVQTVCAPDPASANVSGNLSVDDSEFTSLADDFAIIALSGRPTDTTVPATPTGYTLLGSVFNEHGAADVGLAVWGKRLGAAESLPAISVPASWVSSTGGSERHAYYTASVWRGVDDTTAMDAAANTQTGDVTDPANFDHQLPTAVTDRARFISIVVHDFSAGTGDVTEDWVRLHDFGGLGDTGLQSGGQWRSIERDVDADPIFSTDISSGTVPFAAVGIALRPAVTTRSFPGTAWQITGVAMLRGEPTPGDLATWTTYFE